MYTIREVLLDSEQAIVRSFLHKHNLQYETDIDYSILVYDQHEVIATASLANNVMKAFAVHKAYIGHNLTGLMFKHLKDVLQNKGIQHFFVFTKPENEAIFQSFFMTSIVKTKHTVLLEFGASITASLEKLKEEYNVSDQDKSCIVMNANPMTLGHLYLIEMAAARSKELLVFVVSEDVSSFPFEARFKIVKEAAKHLKNVTVLPSLHYLVSRMSFPKYFLQEDDLIKQEQTKIDVLIYTSYYEKIFHINKRFVGTEPYSPNTKQYNQTLLEELGDRVTVIERKQSYSKAISASLVRSLLKEGNMEELKEYVPYATLDFLLSEEGKKLIKSIQNKPLGRH
jgi:[citrate (pro-3S)-lyase] ligase